MKNKIHLKKNFVLAIILCLTLFSCKTYTIPKESFKQQFIGVDNASLEVKNVKIVGIYNKKFFSNNLATIVVMDKDNKAVEILNRPSIEMRITTTANKKHIMYFDTVYIENDTLYGSKARLISLKETKIPFDKISKIEIQDGKKYYRR